MTTPTEPTTAEHQDRVLIIGGGVAAGSTALGLRDRDVDRPVTVVTDEDHLPYERPALSKDVLVGEADPAGATVMRSRDEWDALGVEVLTGRAVTALDVEGRSATLDDGRELGWNTAVIATGARPRTGMVDGEDLDGVHHLRTIEDAERLAGAIGDAEVVAIVGGSWIGAEVASAARSHGTRATMITPEEGPMASSLGRQAGHAWRDLHRRNGTVVRTGRTVESIIGEDAAEAVVLDDGQEVEADLVVLGTGVEPATDLAEQAGLDVNDGILVDEQFRTSDPSVLAVGDVAARQHPRLGRIRTEHVEVARAHGDAAAATIAGEDEVLDDLPLAYSDQYDVGLELVGDPTGIDEVVTRGDVDGMSYVAFHLRDGVVRAGHHANVWGATDIVRQLVGLTADPDVLTDEGVDLEDLPRLASR